MLTVEVCFWDLADIDADDEHVCFWGNDANGPLCRLMTDAVDKGVESVAER